MASDEATRRRFMQGMAGIAGATALSGCLGGGNEGGDVGEITGPYQLRMWHGAYASDRIDGFAEEHGIEAQNQSFEDPGEPYSQIQADQYAGDNISFLHEWGQRAWENDLLEPIDTTELDNIDNLDDRWQTMNEVNDGEQWGIPYDVGIFPLTYNTDEFSEAPTSWEVLWDDAYEGRILMQDSATTSCQLAALYTGQDPLDPDDFDDIEEALDQQSELVQSYWSEFETGMRQYVDGTVDVGQLTVGRTIQAAVDHDTNVEYTVPDEGAMTYFDEFCIPHNARNVGTAYAWIDDYLNDGGPRFTELERYRATTEGLDDNLPEELEGWYDWPDEWDLHTQDLLDEDVLEQYDQIWTRIRG